MRLFHLFEAKLLDKLHHTEIYLLSLFLLFHLSCIKVKRKTKFTIHARKKRPVTPSHFVQLSRHNTNYFVLSQTTPWEKDQSRHHRFHAITLIILLFHESRLEKRPNLHKVSMQACFQVLSEILQTLNVPEIVAWVFMVSSLLNLVKEEVADGLNLNLIL